MCVKMVQSLEIEVRGGVKPSIKIRGESASESKQSWIPSMIYTDQRPVHLLLLYPGAEFAKRISIFICVFQHTF